MFFIWGGGERTDGVLVIGILVAYWICLEYGPWPWDFFLGRCQPPRLIEAMVAVDIPLGDVVQTHGFSRPLDVLNGFKGPTVQPSRQVADKRYQESTGFPA